MSLSTEQSNGFSQVLQRRQLLGDPNCPVPMTSGTGIPPAPGPQPPFPPPFEGCFGSNSAYSNEFNSGRRGRSRRDFRESTDFEDNSTNQCLVSSVVIIFVALFLLGSRLFVG